MLARDRVADALLAVEEDLERNGREVERLAGEAGRDAEGAGARLARLEEEGARLRDALAEMGAAFDALVPPPAVPDGEEEGDEDEGEADRDFGPSSEERLELRVSLAGPVREPTAAALFAALAAHAQAVQRQLTFLDEKDVGERGDGHIAAVLAVLGNAC